MICTEITRLNFSFLEKLKHIHRECFKDIIYSDSSYKNFLDKNIFRTYGIIDTSNDNLLAFIILTTNQNEADIVSIGVTKNFRRNGFAKSLIYFCIRKYYLKKIFLEVSVLNIEAISFYINLDFKKIGIRKNYYKDMLGNEIDSYMMCKNVPRETF
ncbi:MAG: GNAT family N-acetyltransferase [Holosporales bacterium]|jgi:ribosomal protein S18 acetylase RimI-like enzyme|nr:GNAT family N-acetyltransferase [Holosporales bacterium]